MNKLKVLKKIYSLIPISLSGIILILFTSFAFLGPVRKSDDIVLAMFCGTIGSILIVLFLTAVTVFILYKKKLKLNIDVVTSSPEKYVLNTEKDLKLILSSFASDYIPYEFKSDTTHSIIIDSNNIWIPPFISVKVTPLFNVDTEVESFFLNNRTKQQIASLVFSNRGIWNLDRARVQIGDSLGIFSLFFIKKIANPVQIKVYPKHSLKEVTADSSVSEQAGELLPHPVHLSEDYYDLKSYQPGDSANRIIWKHYAKHRKLISRKPERSYNPNLKVSLFVLATKSDDELCNITVKFTKKLTDKGVEVLAGCTGKPNGSNESSKIVKHHYDLRELLVLTAWHQNSLTWSQQFKEFVKSVNQSVNNNRTQHSQLTYLAVSKEFSLTSEGKTIINDCIKIAESTGNTARIITDTNNIDIDIKKFSRDISLQDVSNLGSRNSVHESINNWFILNDDSK